VQQIAVEQFGDLVRRQMVPVFFQQRNGRFGHLFFNPKKQLTAEDAEDAEEFKSLNKHIHLVGEAA
jgi:hypothetical protein